MIVHNISGSSGGKVSTTTLLAAIVLDTPNVQASSSAYGLCDSGVHDANDKNVKLGDDA